MTNHWEVRSVELPLKTPLVAAHGTTSTRQLTLLGLETPVGTCWGECLALNTPGYSNDYCDGELAVLLRFLLPAVADLELGAPVNDLYHKMAVVRGHRFAKAAIEMAWLDASHRMVGVNVAASFGHNIDRVASTAVVGAAETTDRLVTAITTHLSNGVNSIKVKITPASIMRTVIALEAVHHEHPEVALAVDANASFSWAQRALFRQFASIPLAYIEQPFDPDDLLSHARLGDEIDIPVCLDESIECVADAATALTLGAAKVINIKPSRVGGVSRALEIAHLCSELGAGAFCGGMLESGLGRAAALATATAPGMTGPTDLGPTDRYFIDDLCEPIEMTAGQLQIPAGPGFGATASLDAIEAKTTAVVRI